MFHDTLGGYLRELSPQARRFWMLVPLTGLVAGIGAVVGVHFLQLVQAVAWHGYGVAARRHASGAVVAAPAGARRSRA